MHLLVYAMAVVVGLQQDGLAPPKTPRNSAVPAPAPVPVSPSATRHGDSVLARVDSHYVAILEKTNQQLSLWWNPYGIFVGALGALFTAGAVVAAYLIFRQSREYRATIDAAIADYRVVLDALLAERLADTKRTWSNR